MNRLTNSDNGQEFMIRIYQIPLYFSTVTDTYRQNEAAPWYYCVIAGVYASIKSMGSRSLPEVSQTSINLMSPICLQNLP